MTQCSRAAPSDSHADAVLSERLGYKASKPLRLSTYDVMTSVLHVAPGAVTPFAGVLTWERPPLV